MEGFYKIEVEELNNWCKKHYKDQPEIINELIIKLDTSEVVVDDSTFLGCTNFNQPINSWD